LAEAQKCQSSLAFSFLLGFEETKRNASRSWSIKDLRTCLGALAVLLGSGA
jgi:hypothetical protein